MNWTLFQNSLLVSALATLLALGFGFLAALWVAGLEMRWRSVILAVGVIALALPPFLVTNCWLHLLGHTGIWRAWLPLNIYSLGGTVWILALLTWPITLLLVLGAWQRLEPSQLESDPALSGTALLRWLLLPQARVALGQAAVLTFVLALNNFAVPAILQTKVFPAEVWVRFNTTFDAAGALQLSLPLVIAPLVLLVCFRHTEVEWPRIEGGVTPRAFRRQLGAGWFRLSAAATIAISVLATGLPLMQLVLAERTWTELPPAFAAGEAATGHSLAYSALAATLCVILGWLIWRWRIGPVLWLPFLMPGVLLGIALVMTLNRPWLGAIYHTAGIVILAFTLRYLAFGWSIASRALRAVDRELNDAAALDGAKGWQLFRHVHWPQIAPQLGVAWYVIYLLCLWDVETLILIVPPGGETLALRIFNLLHYGHNTHVNALCLLLLALAVFPVVMWGLGRMIAARGVRSAARVAAGMALALSGLAMAGCQPAASSDLVSLNSTLFSAVQVIGSRGTGLGQFNKPRSVALDAQDNLYVVDMTGRVQRYSSNGVFLSSWQMPQTDKGKAKGMCADGTGNVVVVEPHYSRVNHFSPAGRLLEQWGEHGKNPGQLYFPRAVAVNSKGETYVSEYGVVERVQRFTAFGKQFLGGFGQAGTGPGEFNRAEGLGVDDGDRVYVADSCNHRVQIFSREGKFLRAHGAAGSGPGQFSYPYDVRVDRNGRQYVCEFGNSRIQIFDAQDQLLETVGGVGIAPGQFNNPWSIALDSQGNLYVADSGNHRVQKFLRKKTEISVQNSRANPAREGQGLE